MFVTMTGTHLVHLLLVSLQIGCVFQQQHQSQILVVSQSVTWFDAVVQCEAMGGHLIQLSYDLADSMVRGLVYKLVLQNLFNTEAWIGSFRLQEDETFQTLNCSWVDNSYYFPWNSDLPATGNCQTLGLYGNQDNSRLEISARPCGEQQKCFLCQVLTANYPFTQYQGLCSQTSSLNVTSLNISSAVDCRNQCLETRPEVCQAFSASNSSSKSTCNLYTGPQPGTCQPYSDPLMGQYDLYIREDYVYVFTSTLQTLPEGTVTPGSLTYFCPGPSFGDMTTPSGETSPSDTSVGEITTPPGETTVSDTFVGEIITPSAETTVSNIFVGEITTPPGETTLPEISVTFSSEIKGQSPNISFISFNTSAPEADCIESCNNTSVLGANCIASCNNTSVPDANCIESCNNTSVLEADCIASCNNASLPDSNSAETSENISLGGNTTNAPKSRDNFSTRSPVKTIPENSIASPSPVRINDSPQSSIRTTSAKSSLQNTVSATTSKSTAVKFSDVNNVKDSIPSTVPESISLYMSTDDTLPRGNGPDMSSTNTNSGDNCTLIFSFPLTTLSTFDAKQQNNISPASPDSSSLPDIVSATSSVGTSLLDIVSATSSVGISLLDIVSASSSLQNMLPTAPEQDTSTSSSASTVNIDNDKSKLSFEGSSPLNIIQSTSSDFSRDNLDIIFPDGTKLPITLSTGDSIQVTSADVTSQSVKVSVKTPDNNIPENSIPATTSGNRRREDNVSISSSDNTNTQDGMSISTDNRSSVTSFDNPNSLDIVSITSSSDTNQQIIETTSSDNPSPRNITPATSNSPAKAISPFVFKSTLSDESVSLDIGLHLSDLISTHSDHHGVIKPTSDSLTNTENDGKESSSSSDTSKDSIDGRGSTSQWNHFDQRTGATTRSLGYTVSSDSGWDLRIGPGTGRIHGQNSRDDEHGVNHHIRDDFTAREEDKMLDISTTTSRNNNSPLHVQTVTSENTAPQYDKSTLLRDAFSSDNYVTATVRRNSTAWVNTIVTDPNKNLSSKDVTLHSNVTTASLHRSSPSENVTPASNDVTFRPSENITLEDGGTSTLSFSTSTLNKVTSPLLNETVKGFETSYFSRRNATSASPDNYFSELGDTVTPSKNTASIFAVVTKAVNTVLLEDDSLTSAGDTTPNSSDSETSGNNTPEFGSYDDVTLDVTGKRDFVTTSTAAANKPSDTRSAVCRCLLRADLKAPEAISVELKENLTKVIEAELKVNASTLSALRMRKECLPDSRPSARALGAVGMALICVVFAFVVCLDVQHMMKILVSPQPHSQRSHAHRRFCKFGRLYR